MVIKHIIIIKNYAVKFLAQNKVNGILMNARLARFHKPGSNRIY